MDNLSNLEIVQQVYRDFATGNMQGVMAAFDKDVIWIRPGEPAIPFSGTFRGTEGLMKMFKIISQTIKIKTFAPHNFFGNGDTVVVIGQDSAEVISTGKTYTSEWVQVFKLKEKKIIYAQIYLDTLEIARAFLS